MTWINGVLIRTRRVKLGISTREISRHSDLAFPVLRRIEDESCATATHTLASFERLADLLGLALVDLFDDSHHTPAIYNIEAAGPGVGPFTCGSSDQVAVTDAAHVIAVLHEQPQLVHQATLALALGWTLKRTLTAIHAVPERLADIGLRLHSAGPRYGLRPGITGLHPVVERIAQLQQAESGMRLSEARYLHRIFRGDALSARQVHDKIHYGALKNAGYISSTGGQDPDLELHPDVKYALQLRNRKVTRTPQAVRKTPLRVRGGDERPA